MKKSIIISILLTCFIGSMSAQRLAPYIEDGKYYLSVNDSLLSQEVQIVPQVEILQLDTIQVDSITTRIDTTIIQQALTINQVAKRQARAWIAEGNRILKRDNRQEKTIKYRRRVIDKRNKKLEAFIFKPKFKNRDATTTDDSEVFKRILKGRSYASALQLSNDYKRVSGLKRVAFELGLSMSGDRNELSQRIYIHINN